MKWKSCAHDFGGRLAERGDDGTHEIQVFMMPEGVACWEIFAGPMHNGERWNQVASGEAPAFEQARSAALDALKRL